MNETEVIEVLVVDDSEYDAEMAMMALQESRSAKGIHWVKDGEEALDFLFAKGAYASRESRNRPKLILLDVKMPKMNGIQVLEYVRKEELTRRIPVVMLTSSKEEKDLVASYDLGANSYVVKPVEFEKFSKAVSDIGHYWLNLNQPKL